MASSTCALSSSLPENRSPANTSRFLIHSGGRIATSSANSVDLAVGAAGDSATLAAFGRSPVSVSMRTRLGVDEDPRVQDACGIDRPLCSAQSIGETIHKGRTDGKKRYPDYGGMPRFQGIRAGELSALIAYLKTGLQQ